MKLKTVNIKNVGGIQLAKRKKYKNYLKKRNLV